MIPTQAPALTEFHWEVQPQAEALVQELVHQFFSLCTLAQRLAERMQTETGTRFQDWLDHLVIPEDGGIKARLKAVGFQIENQDEDVYAHPGGIFPRVRIGDRHGATLKVDSVADFLAAHQMDVPVEGAPLSPLRAASVCRCAESELAVMERHGWCGFTVPEVTDAQRVSSLAYLEAFQTRRRKFDEPAEGFAHAEKLLDRAIAELGRDWTCDLFFAAERGYWQRRNRAARVQRARQDTLGLGWANHDHHTYRSSREWFVPLMQVFEKLGFEMRERFTPGREAGWGAQIIEQPVTGVTIFADVDMSPEELLGDFAHEPMSARKELGTVGLWCALHGEAFLEAGMHHLECQFDFDRLREQLQSEGVGTMKPFTDFSYLRQAFTEGERWAVDPARIDRLLAGGRITAQQADKFRREGALGSHLENLERNQGFKGFNQTGITEIIAATDPRQR